MQSRHFRGVFDHAGRMIVFDGGTPTPDLPKLSTQCRWSGEGIPGLSCIAQAPEVPSCVADRLCHFPDTDTCGGTFVVVNSDDRPAAILI